MSDPAHAPLSAHVGASPALRVLIADDHPLLVEGLLSLLEAHGIEVVGTAGNGQEACDLALQLHPDVVVMDIRMPVCDGLAATRLIKARQPEIKVVILTTSAEDADLFEAIRSGANGYLLKSTNGPAFIEALHALEAGVPPFSPGLAARLLNEFARLSAGERGEPSLGGRGDKEKREETEPARLTERQTEVLRQVAAGLTYKQVGAALGLSEVTVRYHIGEIMRLLHLEHRSQVIAYAARHGLEKARQK